MIEITNPKINLISEALSASLYRADAVDNKISIFRIDGLQLTTSDEAAIQAIIDSYDPLPKAKADAKARLVEQFNAVMSDIENAYPEAVKRTFDRQESEAREYVANNAVIGSTLQRLATKRGITVDDLATKIITKADALRVLVDDLNGDMQALEDQIESETNWQTVEQINLGV